MSQSIKGCVRNPLVIGGGLWLSLWVWNWPLAVAIASGTGVAIAVYLYQLDRLHVSWFQRFAETDVVLGNQQIWQKRLSKFGDRNWAIIPRLWTQCWQPINRPLTLSLLCGGFCASVVATMGLIYRDLHSLSLVLAMGTQLLLVSIIGYGFWKQSKRSVDNRTTFLSGGSDESDSQGSAKAVQRVQQGRRFAIAPTDCDRFINTTATVIDQLWVDLTSNETAIRLVAIYRAVNWVQSIPKDGPKSSLGMNAQKLTACFRVMLSQESNPNVQQALRDGLMTLQNLEIIRVSQNG